MKHQPERTCIGCRSVFSKDDVIRIVAVGSGVVIDYREKLPGRAAYVCPRQDCIRSALSKENLSRALRARVEVPRPEDFIALLTAAVTDRIKSLVLMAAKAGKLAAGYSAVRDGLEKGTIEMLLCAADLSDGTREKIGPVNPRVRQATLFTKEALGTMLGREAVGITGIQDRGFAEALGKETERLKGLIKAGQ